MITHREREWEIKINLHKYSKLITISKILQFLLPSEIINNYLRMKQVKDFISNLIWHDSIIHKY